MKPILVILAIMIVVSLYDKMGGFDPKKPAPAPVKKVVAGAKVTPVAQKKITRKDAVDNDVKITTPTAAATAAATAASATAATTTETLPQNTPAVSIAASAVTPRPAPAPTPAPMPAYTPAPTPQAFAPYVPTNPAPYTPTNTVHATGGGAPAQPAAPHNNPGIIGHKTNPPAPTPHRRPR